jgi:hypothetical protein
MEALYQIKNIASKLAVILHALFSQEEEPRSERLAGMEALYQIKNIASKLPVEQGKIYNLDKLLKKKGFLSSTFKELSSEMDLAESGINR